MTTGFLSLDAALGGGIVEGGVVESFGAASSGKSTLSLHYARQCLKRDGDVGLYLDYEQSFDFDYAAQITGLQVLTMDETPAPGPVLYCCQPDTLETGTDLALDLSKELGGKLRLVVCDSLAAMTPKAQLEGEIGDQHVGLQARLLGKFLSNASKRYTKVGTTLWIVNQIRTKIGGMGGFGSGPPTQSAGGMALQFYAWQRLSMSSGEMHAWKGHLPEGSHASYIKVEKNKTSPRRKGRTKLVIWPGRGISWEVELLDLMINHGVLKTSSGGFTMNGKGPYTKASLLRMLTDNPRAAEYRTLFTAALQSAVPDGAFVVPVSSGD